MSFVELDEECSMFIVHEIYLQNYQYAISSDCEISVKERKAADTKKAAAEPAVDPESLATFRINFDEDELAARNALKLPYEK